MRVREARADEWAHYKRLRLRALEDSPDSFRVTFDESVRKADSDWAEQLAATVAHDEAATFFAEIEEPVGITYASIRDRQLRVAAMWVAPEARGLGFGKALLEAALAWGKVRGVTSARLAVTIGNDGGERLYTAAGFEPTGETEPVRDGSDLNCAWLERPL